jgi:ribonuclease D
MTTPIAEPGALAARLAAHAGASSIGVDTEFLRERTYFAQLCLVQLCAADECLCIDTLALQDLSPLQSLFANAAIVKVLHAARQDLEVLWPAAGPVRAVYDTQVAAALTGLPPQTGYAELVSRLLNVQLAKAHTRTDWSRRPLSAEQVEYALDDVRYLLPLRDMLDRRLQELGRSDWFAEEMQEVAAANDYAIDPVNAWQRLKGLAELDEDRRRLAQLLGAWRERRAISSNRPRGWLLPDAALRDIVFRVPRTESELAGISELPDGIRNNSGAQLLQLVAEARIPDPPPPLPQRRRPDDAWINTLNRLADIAKSGARELDLAPEMLATRRELELLAGGARDVGPLHGWRRAVIGERLLSAL